MLRIISIHSRKGGVGKTSIALSAALQLAAKGKRVALLELDSQGGHWSQVLRLERDWKPRTRRGKSRTWSLVKEGYDSRPRLNDYLLSKTDDALEVLRLAERPLCTDNAGMIGALAELKLRQGVEEELAMLTGAVVVLTPGLKHLYLDQNLIAVVEGDYVTVPLEPANAPMNAPPLVVR